MKAAVFLGPGQMEIREVARPVCGKGEVLLRIKACAICGTDVRIFQRGQKNVRPPHVVGHEIAGIVEETGAGAGDLKPGTRVTLVTTVGCGKCRFCRQKLYNMCPDFRATGYHYPGGFAEFILIPAESVSQGNILPIGKDLGFAEASLAEPLSCCINGQDYLKIGKGDAVVVFGAGPIGSMHAELAKAQGAAKVLVVDVSSRRLELAARFSADLLINGKEKDAVKEILAATGGEGADVLITACASGEAQEQAVRAAGRKSRISFFGGLPHDNSVIKLDSNLVHYREISIFGAFASNRGHFLRALELIGAGTIAAEKFITHRLPLEKIVAGLEIVRSGEGLKVVIEP